MNRGGEPLGVRPASLAAPLSPRGRNARRVQPVRDPARARAVGVLSEDLPHDLGRLGIADLSDMDRMRELVEGDHLADILVRLIAEQQQRLGGP